MTKETNGQLTQGDNGMPQPQTGTGEAFQGAAAGPAYLAQGATYLGSRAVGQSHEQASENGDRAFNKVMDVAGDAGDHVQNNPAEATAEVVDWYQRRKAQQSRR